MDKRSALPWWAIPVAGATGIGVLWWVGKQGDRLLAERRSKFWELYDRSRPFPNATLANLNAVRARNNEIARIAVEIMDAAGTFNDNEGAIVAAFRQLRSRYEIYWLNRTFSYLFDRPEVAPQLGAWLDARIDDGEWIPILSTLNTLPAF